MTDRIHNEIIRLANERSAGWTAKIIRLVAVHIKDMESKMRAEEADHLENILNNPTGPSPLIEEGAALLERMRRKER